MPPPRGTGAQNRSDIEITFVSLPVTQAAALLRLLPTIMHIEKNEGQLYRRILSIAEYSAVVRRELSIGRSVIISRLTELFLLSVILAYFQKLGKHADGMLLASPKSGISRVLGIMSTSPGASYDLTELAGLAGMSRTTFATAFRRATGVSPIKFLVDLRMKRSAGALRAENTAIEDIATAAGYSTRASFERAFQRKYRTTPHQFRAASRNARPAGSGEGQMAALNGQHKKLNDR
jgi:AraC-like DNA-binding protein